MPGKIVVVNYNKCDPKECKDGICRAISACPKKIIKQEEPYEAPMINISLCSGCYKCIKACPRKAIEKVR
jgi:translation initiation factor RLI1